MGRGALPRWVTRKVVPQKAHNRPKPAARHKVVEDFVQQTARTLADGSTAPRDGLICRSNRNKSSGSGGN